MKTLAKTWDNYVSNNIIELDLFRPQKKSNLKRKLYSQFPTDTTKEVLINSLETKISSLSKIILSLKDKNNINEKLLNTVSHLSKFADIEQSLFIKYEECSGSLSYLNHNSNFESFSSTFSKNLLKVLTTALEIDTPIYMEIPTAYLQELPWKNGSIIQTILAIPVIIEDELMGFVLAKSKSLVLQVSQLDKQILQSIAFQIALLLQNSILKEKSQVDFLTGLKSREAFEKDITQNSKNRFGLILFDIDNFKLVNDNFGHHYGDMVLKEVKNIIARTGINIATSYRVGGEEFAIILSNESQISIIEHIAQGLRAKFENTKFSKVKNLTISLGCGSFDQTQLVEQFIHQVDKVLYVAKNAGKNQVCCISS